MAANSSGGQKENARPSIPAGGGRSPHAHDHEALMTATAAPSPTGRPAYADTFRRTPVSIAEARRLVRTALFAWALDDLADDGAVVVSELATNAIRHARSRDIRVTVTRLAPARVRIGVVDKSRKFPVPCKPNDDDTHGRGLAVVEHLALRWGTDPLPWGKRVWAELARDVPGVPGVPGEAAETVETAR
jgi:hypothetical protein